VNVLNVKEYIQRRHPTIIRTLVMVYVANVPDVL
jgi:hypothetical protein